MKVLTRKEFLNFILGPVPHPATVSLTAIYKRLQIGPFDPAECDDGWLEEMTDIVEIVSLLRENAEAEDVEAHAICIKDGDTLLTDEIYDALRIISPERLPLEYRYAFMAWLQAAPPLTRNAIGRRTEG